LFPRPPTLQPAGPARMEGPPKRVRHVHRPWSLSSVSARLQYREFHLAALYGPGNPLTCTPTPASTTLREATAMNIESRNPENQKIIRTKIQNGESQTVDELIHTALVSLPSTTPSERPRRTRAEAIAHINEARKGNKLPQGVTIRDLINQGRA